MGIHFISQRTLMLRESLRAQNTHVFVTLTKSAIATNNTVSKALLVKIVASERVIVAWLLLIVYFGPVLYFLSVGHTRIVKFSVWTREALLVSCRFCGKIFSVVLSVLGHLDQILSVEIHVLEVDMSSIVVSFSWRITSWSFLFFFRHDLHF